MKIMISKPAAVAASTMAAAVITALSGCGGDGSAAPATGAQLKSMVVQGGSAPAAALSSPYGTVVQQLYIAYFGRPADSEGLANFESALAAAGAPADVAQLAQAYGSNAAVKNLIDSFGASEESQRLYGGDTQAFVNAVFTSILNRPPQAAGLKFWSDAINNGVLTRGNAALSIMAGALANQSPQGLVDAGTVRNKVAVGASFTASLVSPANVGGYKGPAAATAARALLAAVDSATDTAQYQGAVAKAVARLSVRVDSGVPVYQWNLAQAPQLTLTDPQGTVLPLTGARCTAVDPVALVVASDCSTVQGKRLGAQRFTVTGDNVTATVALTVIPQRQPLGTQGVANPGGSGDYTLLATSAGNVVAWGSNASGVLGQGTLSPTIATLPVLVKDSSGKGVLSNIVSVSAGDTGAMALTADGEVWAWGGGGYTGSSYLPVKIVNPANTGSLQHIVQAAMGYSNASALADDGTVYTWGSHTGQGSKEAMRYPNQVKHPSGNGVLRNIVAISAGSNFTLALASDGKVYSWGWNHDGETGQGITEDAILPATVKLATDNSDLSNVVAISAGYKFALALAADGKVYGWGRNGDGQLGRQVRNGSNLRAGLVMDASGAALANIKMVSAGGWHAMALDNGGRVLTWGLSNDGRLGDGPNGRASADTGTPLPVVGMDATGELNGIVAIAAGYGYSLALSADRTLLMWGNGYGGVLGQGGTNTRDSWVPTPVKNAAGTGPLQLEGMDSYLNLLKRGR